MKRKLFLLMSILLLSAITATAKVWYVGTWTGKPVEDVKASIIDAYTDAGADDEIWIAAGTYEIGSGGINYGAAKNLKFYGGFAGNENSIDERAKVAGGAEWEFQNTTTLKSIVTGSSIFWINAAVTTTIDGLTIDGDNNVGARGIGVTTAPTKVTISRCQIRNCNAGASAAYGGGIDIKKQTIIEYCLIENNTATRGGGIEIEAGSNSSITNCIIRNNKATGADGGGLDTRTASGTVVSYCIFDGNETVTNGGGGIYADNNVTVHHCIIRNNKSVGGGAGISANGLQGSFMNVYNCLVENNIATSGTGGINGNRATIYNCLVVNNTGGNAGGIGLDIRYASKVYNNTVVNNRTTLDDDAATGNVRSGGLVFYNNANATRASSTVYNTVFWNNKNKNGEVVNFAKQNTTGTNNSSALTANVYNCLTDRIDYADVSFTDCIVATDGSVIFNDDSNGDYTLKAGSPAIDNGIMSSDITLPDVDFAENVRIIDGIVDIGAYELVVPTTNISIDNGTGETLVTGETVQLLATVLPANASNLSVTWASSDPAVATVTATGFVTAVSAGNANITATTKWGQTATYALIVTAPATPVVSVTLSQNTAELTRLGTLQLVATVLPENADNKNVTWSSSDPAVATVSATGLVKAISGGTANITVTTLDGGKTDMCVITVQGGAATLYVGDAWGARKTHDDVNTAYSDADAGDRVWVATGTYTVSITVKNDVSIYGGFAGTENSIDDRAKMQDGKSWEFVNPTVFITTSAAVITGIAGNNGMTIDGVTFDGENTAAARRVFQFSNGVTSANYVISNCVIKNFVSNIASGGELINLRNKTEMRNCLITNNKTTASGAIVYLDYSCWMHDCEVTNNTAAGNLLSVNYTSGSGDCYNMYVANNTAGGTAGINAHGANVYNCVVVNNTSTSGSGGIAIDGRKAASVFNNTIANNTGATTGGLAFYTNATASAVAATAVNNILWNNKKGSEVHNFVRLKDIAANVNNNILDRTDYADIIFSDCVINTDSAAIFVADWVTAGTSPAVDAGSIEIAVMPATDFAGNTRVVGATIDIGAYEDQNGEPYVNPNIALFDDMMEKIRNEKESEIDIDDLVTDVSGYTYNLSGVCNVAAGGNGFFPDIDYSDNQGNSYPWKATTHLNRLLNMAYAYTMDGSSLKGNATLFAAIEAGINAWTQSHPTASTNWWYNQIAEPKALGLLLIQMRKGDVSLPEDVEAPVLTRLYDRSLSGYPGTGNATSSANIIDVAEHGIYSGLLSYDAGRVRTMFDSFIYPNVKISTGVTADGIKPDQSHIMHDRVLYIGGYGEVFITGITYFTKFTAGTPYAMPEDKAEILSNFVRNTWAKAIRGRYMLWDVTGRGVSRIAELDKRGAAVYLERMKTIDPANASEYDDAIKRLREEEAASYGITPLSRQHFIADHTLHIRPEYTFDVNFVSTRTRRIEWGNGENNKALYMSDGCTNIVRRGDEYKTIFGTWNWARVPGVTCLQTPSQATINNGSTTSVTGTSTFAGGVTDSLYSVTAYYYPDGRVNLSAKKGWFMFDDEIVCLGNSITAASGQSAYDANTTLNQCNLNGDVAASENGSEYSTLAEGEHPYADAPKWVQHDGVGYVFPDGGNVVVSNQAQTGNWYDINNRGTNAVVSRNTFTMYFNHGKDVTNGDYAYIIVPGKTADEMQSYYAAANIEILANDASKQVVRHKGLGMYGIIFYNAASYSDERISVEADKGCVLLLKDKGNYYQMNIADPAQAETQINVKTKFPASATEWTNTLCDFAGTGDYRGASKAYTVQKQTVSYEVNVNLGEGIVSVTPASATVVSGSEFTATFVVAEGYENPTVTGGTAEITGNTLRIASVTENITLTLSATRIPEYEVNINLGEGIESVTPASATVVSGSEFTATFVVAENYEDPFVTGGTAEITDNTLRIASVTENITLTISATRKVGMDLINQSYVDIYPNPVKAGKTFIISLGDKFTDATVGIYSVTGVKLDEKKANGNVVEQVVNRQGMYIVTVKKNAETYTFKVVVE
jgi:chondroitin AC lyase